MHCFMAVEGLYIFLLYGIIHIPCIQGWKDEYYLINLKKNWTDAQQYCRDHYTDLATIESTEDLNRIPARSSWTWIGLHDDPASWKGVMTADSNSWRWSATGTTSPGGYHNWAENEPDYYEAREHCTVMGNGRWLDADCSKKLHFACYTVQSSVKQYTVLGTRKTWASAQSYCRVHYQDLAMIENSEENEALTSKLLKSAYSWVWIGLYRKPWRWSDNNPSTFRDWHKGEPSNGRSPEHCGVLWSKMGDYYCSRLFPFICMEEKRSLKAVNMQFQSALNLTDPAIADQILRQLKDRLGSDGVGLKLKWKKPPTKITRKKKKKKEEL